MTREELRDYVEKQRSLNMIPYHVYSTLIDGIDTLEQESILDKIRAEIVELTKCPYGTECLGANCPSNTDCMICGDHVLEILDKYKEERGGEE